MITIIHYYLGIVDGVFTNLIDLYRNLKSSNKPVSFRIIIPYWFPVQLKDVKFCATDYGISNNLDFMNNNGNFGSYDLFACLTDHMEHISEIIITSMRTLYEISEGVPLKFKCDRFIVLDTLDSTRVKLNQFRNLDKYVPCDDAYFLSNPSNLGITSFKEIEYYHKLNKIRFNYMPWLTNPFYYSRKDRPKAKIKAGCYAENIGKIIFEHLYMEDIVYYSPIGKFMDDGLTYYLKLFNVDADKKQVLDISRSQLKEKLFFHEEDQLLTLL